MSPPAIPARITIDFRDSLDPARGWILGVRESRARVELLAFEGSGPEDQQAPSGAADAGCTCPDFCERDHDVD